MIQYTDCVDIFVMCPHHEVQRMLDFVLPYNGFQVQWYSQLLGMAHQGNKEMNFILGPWSLYHEILFQLFPMPDKTFVIRLIKSFRGYHLGRGRWLDFTLIERKFIETVNLLTYYFHSLGWLGRVVFY